MPPGFLCSALPTLDILLDSDFWTSTLLLPPDYRSLPNPCICLPESASPFMTLLLCPDRRFKPLPWILSHDSASLGLIQFLSPDYRTLLSHSEYKPESPCDVVLLSLDHHTKELKFSLLISQRILKRDLRRPW
ncbi:hypothetical protein ILYODFUR_004392 [Ilyodon furcidens]|uniref:Uncharacterized protein n=1 Tax=Ilyodon furcidens TaxID=33524 RepID=A0ABV0TS91_9TELE